jgi:hypothetical protein
MLFCFLSGVRNSGSGGIAKTVFSSEIRTPSSDGVFVRTIATLGEPQSGGQVELSLGVPHDRAVSDGPDGLAVDEEGDEVPEPSVLRGPVEATARDLMRKARLDAIRHWQDCTFEATDQSGQLVLTLPFTQVSSGG